jgi:NADPH:quinone reductase-like Zn-dependent oxidoreductase
MKAIVYEQYGSPDVLELKEIDKPSPGDDEVLIKVRAVALNPLDWRIMGGKPFIVRLFARRIPKPRRPGVDVAGVVEAVGRNVTELKPGDEVFGSCAGALAEYACGPAVAIAKKAANVTFEQAAAVNVGGRTALQGLHDDIRVQPGQKVLINGAAGGVGTYAVQIAKWLGAEVTGVCSTANVDMVRSIGADRVIDYTRDDFTQGADRYDVIFDCIGNHGLRECRRVMTPHAVYLAVGGPFRGLFEFVIRLFAPAVLSRLGSQKFRLVMTKRNKEHLRILRDLMESGKVTSVLDGHYTFDQSREAMRHLMQGHARGKVVITVSE